LNTTDLLRLPDPISVLITACPTRTAGVPKCHSDRPDLGRFKPLRRPASRFGGRTDVSICSWFATVPLEGPGKNRRLSIQSGTWSFTRCFTAT